MLCLRCCTQAFSSCRELGYSSWQRGGFSLRWLPLLQTVGSGERRLQWFWHVGLVALWRVGSSWTRDWSHVPCTGRWILNHWTTREVPLMAFKKRSDRKKCLKVKVKLLSLVWLFATPWTVVIWLLHPGVICRFLEEAKTRGWGPGSNPRIRVWRRGGRLRLWWWGWKSRVRRKSH